VVLVGWRGAFERTRYRFVKRCASLILNQRETTTGRTSIAFCSLFRTRTNPGYQPLSPILYRSGCPECTRPREQGSRGRGDNPERQLDGHMKTVTKAVEGVRSQERRQNSGDERLRVTL
jgi:hypothetical protein